MAKYQWQAERDAEQIIANEKARAESFGLHGIAYHGPEKAGYENACKTRHAILTMGEAGGGGIIALFLLFGFFWTSLPLSIRIPLGTGFSCRALEPPLLGKGIGGTYKSGPASENFVEGLYFKLIGDCPGQYMIDNPSVSIYINKHNLQIVDINAERVGRKNDRGSTAGSCPKSGKSKGFPSCSSSFARGFICTNFLEFKKEIPNIESIKLIDKNIGDVRNASITCEAKISTISGKNYGIRYSFNLLQGKYTNIFNILRSK